MVVLVQREAVPGVDEASMPLARPLNVPETATVGDLLRLVRVREVLPVVVGGATWVCEGDRPLAIVPQEYREPWPLPGGNRPLAEAAGVLPRPHFLFRYAGQESPEEVYRRLGGDPVRLPREAWEPSGDISWGDALRRFFSPDGRAKDRRR